MGATIFYGLLALFGAQTLRTGRGTYGLFRRGVLLLIALSRIFSH
jgi:hypothetical protein